MNNDFVKKNQEKMKQAKQMFHEETQKEDFLEEEKPQEAKKPTKKELFFKILISLFLLWIGIPVIGMAGIFVGMWLRDATSSFNSIKTIVTIIAATIAFIIVITILIYEHKILVKKVDYRIERFLLLALIRFSIAAFFLVLAILIVCFIEMVIQLHGCSGSNCAAGIIPAFMIMPIIGIPLVQFFLIKTLSNLKKKLGLKQ